MQQQPSTVHLYFVKQSPPPQTRLLQLRGWTGQSSWTHLQPGSSVVLRSEQRGGGVQTKGPEGCETTPGRSPKLLSVSGSPLSKPPLLPGAGSLNSGWLSGNVPGPQKF